MAMSDLDNLLAQVLAIKPGEEFALFYCGDDNDDEAWRADLGNRLASVSLGEVAGEFRGEGKTAVDALTELIAAIHAGKSRYRSD